MTALGEKKNLTHVEALRCAICADMMIMMMINDDDDPTIVKVKLTLE